jgi:hypothetical protein
MFEQANGCGTSDSREEIMKIQAAVMTADYAMQVNHLYNIYKERALINRNPESFI